MNEPYNDGERFTCPGCGARREYSHGDLSLCDVRICAECCTTELDAIATTVEARYERVCRERDELLRFYEQIMASAKDTGRDTTLTAWAADQMLRANLGAYSDISHPVHVAMMKTAKENDT